MKGSDGSGSHASHCQRWGLGAELAQYVDPSTIVACAAFEPDDRIIFGDVGPLGAVDMALRLIAVDRAGGAKHSLWVVTADELVVLVTTGGKERRNITGKLGRWPLTEVSAERVVRKLPRLLERSPVLQVRTPDRRLKVRAELLDEATEAVIDELCDR